jgi:hypothetical protein
MLKPGASAAATGRNEIGLRIGQRTPEGKRGIPLLQVAALAELLGNISRDVLRPFFGGVEGNDAERTFVLPLEQIENDGFHIGLFDVSFVPDPAMLAQVVHHQIDVLIVAAGHDRGRPAGLTHYRHTTKVRIQASARRIVPRSGNGPCLSGLP